MSTEEMVRLCIMKDKAAWNEFVRRYQDLVRKAVYYKLYKTSSRAPRNDVDDIVQEVFLTLWKNTKLAQLRDISSLTGWLAVVTINQTAIYRRRQHKKDMMTVSLNERISEDIATTLENVVPCNQPDPARVAEIKESTVVIEQRIGALRSKERRALRLKINYGKTQEDIASIMNIPANTVASLIRRAKMKVCASLVQPVNI